MRRRSRSGDSPDDLPIHRWADRHAPVEEGDGGDWVMELLRRRESRDRERERRAAETEEPGERRPFGSRRR